MLLRSVAIACCVVLAAVVVAAADAASVVYRRHESSGDNANYQQRIFVLPQGMRTPHCVSVPTATSLVPYPCASSLGEAIAAARGGEVLVLLGHKYKEVASIVADRSRRAVDVRQYDPDGVDADFDGRLFNLPMYRYQKPIDADDDDDSIAAAIATAVASDVSIEFIAHANAGGAASVDDGSQYVRLTPIVLGRGDAQRRRQTAMSATQSRLAKRSWLSVQTLQNMQWVKRLDDMRKKYHHSDAVPLTAATATHAKRSEAAEYVLGKQRVALLSGGGGGVSRQSIIDPYWPAGHVPPSPPATDGGGDDVDLPVIIIVAVVGSLIAAALLLMALRAKKRKRTPPPRSGAFVAHQQVQPSSTPPPPTAGYKPLPTTPPPPLPAEGAVNSAVRNRFARVVNW